VGPADFTYYSTYILHRFFAHHVFLVLPPSKTFPYVPRNLPNAILVAESPTKRKPGRKSKKEKGQLALAGIRALEELLNEPDVPVEDSEIAAEYDSVRQQIIAGLSKETIQAAEFAVSQKLQSPSLSGPSALPQTESGQSLLALTSNSGSNTQRNL
jgi:hypothetical protein